MNSNAQVSVARPFQAYVFSMQSGLVAQISNLPYRRFVVGRASESSSALPVADPSSGSPAEGGRAAECNSAIQRSAAKPHPKERGVYAASTLEVPQAVKREEALENLSAEAA